MTEPDSELPKELGTASAPRAKSKSTRKGKGFFARTFGGKAVVVEAPAADVRPEVEAKAAAKSEHGESRESFPNLQAGGSSGSQPSRIQPPPSARQHTDSNNHFPPRNAASDSTSLVTIVMVGATGQGKSTLGNMLAGALAGCEPFGTSDAFDSETLEAAHCDFIYDGRSFRVIDTIGFLDTRMDAAQNMDKFAGFADRAPLGIDAFLFVLKKGRFTEQQGGQLGAFRAIAGEDALSHAVLAFTHCGDEASESLQARCQASTNKHLQSAVQSCCGSVIGVDSMSADRHTGDRDAVLNEVLTVIQRNRCQKYNNATLLEAKRSREELQRRIEQLTKERRDTMNYKLEGMFNGRISYADICKAVDEAFEKDDAERKAQAERFNLKALLQVAKSEAEAWKQVAVATLAGKRKESNQSMLGLAGCCEAPQFGGGGLFPQPR